MATNLTAQQVETKLAALKLTLPADIPFQLETLFARLDGWGTKRYIHRKHKLIRLVAGRLRKVIKPGEEVLSVGKGVYASFLEQFFMGGLVANLINQTVFVLTNLRLIMLHSNTKGVPTDTCWTIFHSQIKSFRSGWTGKISLVLQDGRQLAFSGFEKLDREQMPKVFERAVATQRELGFNPSVSQSRENMCSQCYEIVPKKQFRCVQCGTEFWTPKEISARSFIFPSWGDFLMGHTAAAIIELIVYAVTWCFNLVSVVSASADGMDEFIGAIVGFAIVLGIVHSIDAAMTYAIAGKGLHPKRRKQSG